MTPAQARAFQAVASTGSFTAAARSLGVSQPTVTNQVKQLELHYAVELFHRSGRGARLTETGVELLAIVRRMFGSHREAVEFLQASQGMRRGHLRLGAYGPYAAMRLMARFRQRYPAIRTSMTLGNSRTLGKELLDYTLDVGILTLVEARPEFHVIPFGRPPLIAIAPATRVWKAARSISPAELAKQQLIRREPGSVTREAFDRLLADAGLSPGNVIEVSSREGVVRAVAEGMGLAAIFDDGVVSADRVVKLRIRDCDIRTSVDVACLAERRDSPIIRGFLDIAQEMSGHSF